MLPAEKFRGAAVHGSLSKVGKLNRCEFAEPTSWPVSSSSFFFVAPFSNCVTLLFYLICISVINVYF